MSVFLSRLTIGEGSNNLDGAFSFDLPFRIVLAKPFGPEMEMRRFDVRLVPMLGLEKTAQTCQFRIFMDLPCLQVNL